MREQTPSMLHGCIERQSDRGVGERSVRDGLAALVIHAGSARRGSPAPLPRRLAPPGTRRRSTSNALEKTLARLVVRNAPASAQRFERGDESLLLVWCKDVVSALNDVLPRGQA